MMKDFKIWVDGVGLLEMIIVYVSMSLIVLKVLGMLAWSWFRVLLPSTGFLIIIAIQVIRWVIIYDKEHNYERKSNRVKD